MERLCGNVYGIAYIKVSDILEVLTLIWNVNESRDSQASLKFGLEL